LISHTTQPRLCNLRHADRTVHREASHFRHDTRPHARRSLYDHLVLLGEIQPNSALSSPAGVPWKEKISALKGIWETGVIFLLVIGGIYTGLFTPTEAAGIGATLIFLMAIWKKKLTLRILLNSLMEALRVSVMVLFLVAGANVFSYFLALTTIPMKVSAWIIGLAVSRYVILTIIVLIYLLLGCFLDAISMMILTLPVIFPVVLQLGFDPIWFGVICVLMMERVDTASRGALCQYSGQHRERRTP